MIGESYIVTAAEDPLVPDWHSLVLPVAWPDTLDFSKPSNLWHLLKQVVRSKRPAVELPDDMPGREIIPKYVLQEFHNLPNGNYSKRITRGYITGFDRVMLGSLKRARNSLADHMKTLGSVLDVGCAGGRMAHALEKAGVEDVWGIDPSPYLLQHAATSYKDVKFVQGVAENTTFPDQRFDGVTACFLLHEMPPHYIDRAFEEFHRILKPGGTLAISEPSGQQLEGSLFSVFRRAGFRGLYFGSLARFVHEPFVEAWHKQDVKEKLAQFGFELIEDNDELPIRQLVALKHAS